MPKESKAQKQTVGRVMHEYKPGELESGTGQPVKSRKQAVAVALHEAGATNQESPEKNRENSRGPRRKSARARPRSRKRKAAFSGAHVLACKGSPAPSPASCRPPWVLTIFHNCEAIDGGQHARLRLAHGASGAWVRIASLRGDNCARAWAKQRRAGVPCCIQEC